ncbi:MAG: discoidin domain-containing protein [Clostridiales bacterium]|jgi:hypothetical protein|nr:discoidin domain-containing protein [Clostridiales bacterium]
MTRKLSIIFLAVIALSACAGIVGLLLTPDEAAQKAALQIHENTEYVTWVKTPEQTEPTTPPEFFVPEPEPFVLPEGENLAKGKKVEFSGFTDVYNGRQATDGRDRTYWEGEAFPSWLSVDLEASYNISAVTIQIPPLRAWGARTQVLKVSVSLDGENWTEVSPELSYDFDTKTGNGFLIEFDAVDAQFVRVDIASNTGAIGGQISELSVFE